MSKKAKTFQHNKSVLITFDTYKYVTEYRKQLLQKNKRIGNFFSFAKFSGLRKAPARATSPKSMIRLISNLLQMAQVNSVFLLNIIN